MTTSTVTLSNEQFQILLERIANPALVSASAVISPPETGNFLKCGSRFSGRLKNAFGKKLPPHRIFRDLFVREQRDDEPTNVFVSTARALLAQLPETPVVSYEISPINREKEEKTPGRPQIVCYGCRQPGHVRSACPARETGPYTLRTAAVIGLEVLCLDTGKQIPRPLIKVDVHLHVGCVAVPTQVNLILVDGVPKLVNAEKLRIPINVEGKLTETAFFAIPGYTRNKTLLEQYKFHAESRTPATVATDAADVVTLRAEEGFHLNHVERNQLSKLLEQHADIFGSTFPLYWLSPSIKAVLQEQLDSMLAVGIIEECDSSYAAPIVLVPKKDGSLRVYIDYRKLNSITVPDRYPLPRINDLLLHLPAKPVHMSSIDLKAGYWQVPVRMEDSDGISVDSKKIQAIFSRPARKDVKGLLSWLQTGSWFRRLILNFAQVVQPVTMLTHKNTRWIWDSAQPEAFDTLKQLLTSISFRLKTHVSAYALGACLLQGEGPEEKPIEYASRLLSPAEQN
ncbi:hypothetical protein ILUMI_17536 [Ignelater luminosus]|uniref:CCHC-type domain-containing protein n=1 Tax=Ignelater luminosus TaxID=2038154 RepID=A0A8K0CQU9_IGNLU|nr:hypothetical protein ILUMI_17536 [Ignelater luminosus]